MPALAAFSGILVVVLLWRFTMFIAVEVFVRAGLPPAAARFQATSGITGSGFTTAESEMVVRNAAGRRITWYLMLFGYMGPVSILTLLGFGVFLPSPDTALVKSGIAIAVAAAILVTIRFGPLVRLQVRLATMVARRVVASAAAPHWRVSNDMMVMAVSVDARSPAVGSTLGDITPDDVTVLAIGVLADGADRETIHPRPDPGRVVAAGDRIFLAGGPHHVEEMRAMAADGNEPR